MLWGLVELIDAVALHVIFPAVIDAAQAAFLVAPEKQRDAAMRAELVEEADATVAVTEGDEVLTQQAHPHRRAIGLGDLARQAGGDPLTPPPIPHRRPPPH